LVGGDYHVVWTYCNGKRRTLDWTAENVSLSEWDMSFKRNEGYDGRQFTVLLHFSSLDLEYILNYQDSVVNKLQLMNNNAPGEGAVENEAVLTFSAIRDEQGYPYLKCNFATNEHDPDGDMVNIEFVAKRTDTEGIRQLGLTKNEKLRLGYAVWDDGTFEPEDSDDEFIGQNPESLNRQLQRHIEASVKIHAKLVTMRNNVDKHVMNATNGMQQAMAQAFRSVSNPAASMQAAPTFERTASPPIARRRKTGLEDANEATPPPPKRRKAGPESTPISMEHEGAVVPRSGPGSRPGRGSGRGGRGGKRQKPEGSGRKRKSMRKSL
jgi:hypothetical protein